jgi:hypothetical protein
MLSILQGALITFILLQIKHFLADFVWQTDRMIQEKGIYGERHGVYHSGIHALGTFVVFVVLHPILGLVCALIDFICHYHIDWAKININKRHNYTPADKKFWFWIGLDQLAHQITYVFLVGWAFFAL